ncbi:uncharacterized protein [Musca autumnalis]|uniref:uncharacterized protein n=1 Tax=Musca autumnalis TaxID=221902 RepID=UPI003CF21CDE
MSGLKPEIIPQSNQKSGSPLKKIRRVDASIDTENQPPTSVNISKATESSFISIAENIQKQLNVIQGQLKIIVEAVATNQVMIENLVRQKCNENPISNKFPITTEEDLIQLNTEINTENKAQYVNIVAKILERGGVLKNFKHIIDDNVSMDYNVDGIHGKKSLKQLKNIYDVILEAVLRHENTSGSGEDLIRKSMQRQKKRVFKRNSVQKSANKN